MNQKDLINSIKQLKEIKPSREWAVLLKSQIVSESAKKPAKIAAEKAGFFNIVPQLFLQRKLAYSFAALIFVVIGLAGFAQYTVPGDLLFPVKKLAEQSEAALTGKTGLKQSAAALNVRVNELAQVAKQGRKDNIPSAISEVNANISELAKNLKDNSIDDPTTIKEIAQSLKTLADVSGTDLTGNPEVKDLYQVIVEKQIEDLEKTTLTDEQAESLEEIKDLCWQGKFVEALEKILLINN